MLKENATIGQRIYVREDDTDDLNKSEIFEINYINEKRSTYEAENLRGTICLKDLVLEDMELVSENQEDWRAKALLFFIYF